MAALESETGDRIAQPPPSPYSFADEIEAPFVLQGSMDMTSIGKVTRRDALVGAAAVLGAGIARSEAQGMPPKPGRLVVNASGGTMGQAMKDSYVALFEQRTGIPVTLTSPNDLGKLKAMVESKNVEWNVTEINSADARRAARLGLLEEIDDRIVDRSSYPAQARDKSLLTTSVYSTLMAFRSDVFKDNRPQTWADFWDRKRFPGPRAMWNSPVDNLEIALLADGAKPDDLYPLDVDRAFKKLTEIKPHVAIWWTSGAQHAQILVDKEVVLSTGWNGRFYKAIQDGAPIAVSWSQGIIKQAYFGIPKGAKDQYWGQQFLSVMLDPKAQATFANLFVSPGLNPDALRYADPAVKSFLPTDPANFKQQFWQNDTWWDANVEAVKERWQRWMLA
jgi:putative spermidine/putrescine transport system substrate-binding protein